MPRKAVQKPADDGQAVAQVAPAPVESKPAKVPKSKKEKEVAVVAQPQPVPVAESTDVQPDSKRRVPTPESVQDDFDALITLVTGEIENLRKNTAKPKGGVRFLLSVNKTIRRLKTHVQRVSKHRPRTRRNNTNSGFLKPVLLSKELSEFTGWDQKVPRSRVDVTKFICSYIAEHNLQNPKNRKLILVENDPKLNSLLKYDSNNKDKKPLDYCHIQTCLKRQNHFLPAPTTEAVSAPAPVKAPKSKKATA